MIRRCLLAAGLALALPAAAAAQEPVPAPAPVPPPPPPVPSLAVALEQVHPVGKGAVVLQGDAFRIRGSLLPAVAAPRQLVTLRIHRNGKLIRTVRTGVRADGTFTRKLPTRRVGRFSIRVFHEASAELGAKRGPKVSVDVVRPSLAAGASGPLVRLLQKGLHRLRYAVPRHDRFDDATGRAVMAYRKVNGMARTFSADERVIRRVLAGKGALQGSPPRRRAPRGGRHLPPGAGADRRRPRRRDLPHLDRRARDADGDRLLPLST